MTQTTMPVTTNMSNNTTRSIRDIISRFEKLDNTPDKVKKQTRFTHNIDLLSRNNNNSHRNLNDNETSKANFTTSSRPISTTLDENYNNYHQSNPRSRPYSTVITTNYYDSYQQPSLVSNSYQNNSSIRLVLNRDPQNDISFPSHNYNRIEKNVENLNRIHHETSYGSYSTRKTSPTPLREINNDKIWNQIRRKSSVQLLKPSWVRRKSKIADSNYNENYHKNYNNDDEDDDSTSDCLLLPHFNPNADKLILPKRATGPIYESRRSSFSAIKPSEIWEPEELPGRRMSKVINENFIMRKKSISNKENHQLIEENDDEEEKSSWVKKPGDSVFLVRPSNVRTAEIQSNDKRFNANSIQSKLLNWCQIHTADYENINITNFSSSWANGLAFCALIHTFFPNAFDYYRLDANDRRTNLTLAFNTAEKYADVPQLLDVDDMIMMNNKPDSKCIFTYVSTFYSRINKLLKENC